MFRIVTHSDGGIFIEGDAAQLMALAKAFIDVSKACSDAGEPVLHENVILDETGAVPVAVRCTKVARID